MCSARILLTDSVLKAMIVALCKMNVGSHDRGFNGFLRVLLIQMRISLFKYLLNLVTIKYLTSALNFQHDLYVSSLL